MIRLLLGSLLFIAAHSIYDFKVPALDGAGTIDFKKFKGKKIMIVNTASKCGNTPQYADLEKLYEQYKDKLVIVGFPANNFGGQEPGTNEEIKTFCSRTYNVTFPMTSKVSVKGDDQTPLFQHLSAAAGEPKWNFTKYLVGKDGKVIAKFDSKVTPDSKELDDAIKAAMH